MISSPVAHPVEDRLPNRDKFALSNQILSVAPAWLSMGYLDDSGSDARQVRQLYSRINRLGLVDRAIILLWLEALSYDEIGGIIGISAKNVAVKLVRIKEQLKKIGDDGE